MNERTLEVMSERAIDACTRLIEMAAASGKVCPPEDKQHLALRRELHAAVRAVRTLARLQEKICMSRLEWRRKVERARRERQIVEEPAAMPDLIEPHMIEPPY